MILQIRRRGDEHECIVILHYLVDVGREENLIYIESCRHQIGRVVPHALEVLDAVIATHIPAYVMSMTHHNLGYCRSPATAANYRYLPQLNTSNEFIINYALSIKHLLH